MRFCPYIIIPALRAKVVLIDDCIKAVPCKFPQKNKGEKYDACNENSLHFVEKC
jgi:hypothetical protein